MRFYSRFVLSGINFSEDESPEIKKDIQALQIERGWLNWIIPEKSSESYYYSEILKIHSEFVDNFRKGSLRSGEPAHHRGRLLYVALRLAGAEDRSLLEEAAKMELSLAKHGLALRRLVLRYMKALSIIIFTALFAAIIANAETFKQHDFLMGEDFVVVAWALTVWFAICPFVVRLPIILISVRREGTAELPLVQDRQLSLFERWTVALALIALFFVSSFLLLAYKASHAYVMVALAVYILYWLFWRKISFARHLSVKDSWKDSWIERFARILWPVTGRPQSSAALAFMFSIWLLLYGGGIYTFSIQMGLPTIIGALPSVVFAFLVWPRIISTVGRIISWVLSKTFR